MFAVRFAGDEPFVVPAFPLFKFDPTAFGEDGIPAAPASNPATGGEKLYYRVDGEFDPRERRLSTICLLDPDDEPRTRTETLTGHDALMSVLEHSWPVRLRNAPYVDGERNTVPAPDIERYGDLVEACRVLRVALERDHDSLERLGAELESVLAVDQT
jgi:hypothetical protein